MPTGRRLAFSLVEVVVVVFIVALLLAMLLPAVQFARESARRSACGVHLRQIGLALAVYADANRGYLPAVMPHRYDSELQVVNESGAAELWSSFSWRTTILPHLEQLTLFDRLAFHRSSLDAMNRNCVQTQIPVYECPTTPRRPRRMAQAGSGSIMHLGVDAATRDYCAVRSMGENAGAWAPGGWLAERSAPLPPNEEWGPAPLNAIADGLSQTIQVVEQAGRPAYYHQGELVSEQTWTDGAWVFGDGGNFVVWSPSSINQSNNLTIHAFHPHGANVLLCDGSVRLLSENESNLVLSALMSRDGGDPVVEEDLP